MRLQYNELPEYRRRLDRMPDNLSDSIGLGYKKEMPRMAETIRGNAPVLTGELRSSIHSEASGLTGSVYTNSVYALIHEFGGHHPVFGRGRVYQPARPYFRPGVAKHMPAIDEMHIDAVRTTARKAGFK